MAFPASNPVNAFARSTNSRAARANQPVDVSPPEREEWPLDPRDFAAYYNFAPSALAVRECIRLRAVRQVELVEPLLDVGCGDGLFARLAYPDKQAWGIDINPDEVQRAQRTSSYRTLVCGNICGVQLPESFFASAIANCSLEHVPDIHAALRNIRRAMRPGATFVMIVPTPQWSRQLAVAELMMRAGLVGLAHAYGDALDNLFSHIHLYDDVTWRRHLADAGFRTTRVTEICGRSASWAFDAMLYPSAFAYVMRRFTKRWIAVPGIRPVSVDIIRAAVNALGRLAPEGGGGAEYMFVAEAT